MTTHGHQECLDACRYFAGLLLGALRGRSKEELLSPLFSPMALYWARHPLLSEKIRRIASGSFRRQPPYIAGTGYVVKSLEAALWSFAHSSSFEEGCLLAANLGNDADTTAAIYGQLAGAYYGEEGIPARWRERLAFGEYIGHVADGFYDEIEQEGDLEP
jgi:ADP-ribosylglycohydrolase